MKKYLLVLLCLSFFGALNAQQSLPYYTGFDNASEKDGWTQYRLGAADPFYQWQFSNTGGKSAPSALLHPYPVGGTDVTNDWFVSPSIDFSQGAILDSIWHKYQGFGTPMAGDTIALHLITGHQNPDSADTRTRLILFSDSTYKNDNIYRFRSGIPIPATADEAYLAFQYKTTNNWLNVNFDNMLVIKDSTATGVNPTNQLKEQLTIYPNPTSGQVQLKTDQGIDIENVAIYNSTGQWMGTYQNPHGSIDVHYLSAGMYLMKIYTDRGMVYRKLVKE